MRAYGQLKSKANPDIEERVLSSADATGNPLQGQARDSVNPFIRVGCRPDQKQFLYNRRDT